MTFEQWFLGRNFDNPPIQGQWGPLHILTMLLSIALIVAFYFIVKKAKNADKVRKIILYSLVSLIFVFEVASRVAYFIYNDKSFLWIMLPKPWCAISCWVLMISALVNKKWFYNFASLSALLCSFIYFCYPGVGFNNKYILFFNLYSIVTHALLLITSISLVTLKFTSFKYNEIWKVAICFAATFAYAFIEIFWLKLERDPLYFMPGGDIQAGILNISYGLYLFLYIFLILAYINVFYVLDDKPTVKKFLARFQKTEKKA